ncbi:TPA: hypothetical protein HA235_00810 [Candidatus Woesearchaeota archaeon]|nr:hypothetical protein [Candidatus Woesearchaeota archaeon]HIH31225.1 hypothetical protein [Candidatus Woesearchaeota archaeon]HIH55516.1 hypothetical protein [Candidatus Woesearchaeota archaeon]HIJ13222.1 hypothetical protein [Candidatus Woesearchaeota archaeon]
MEFIGNTIKIARELSELDTFALDFINILKKHTSYAVISGYVSILLGRSRASEDVDILIPKIGFNIFQEIYADLKKAGFYCINAEDDLEVYNYIKEKLAVRFAKNNSVIPNIELKCTKNKIDDLTLSRTLKVMLSDNKEIIISNLEMQIAFKEKILKSPKDLEDARHIRIVAQGHLDKELIKRYEVMLDDFYK